MPRGDVISVNYTVLSAGSTIDVRPTSGVEWNITFMTASGNYARLHMNSGSYELRCALEAGATSNSADSDQAYVNQHGSRLDLYVTNAQSFRWYGVTGTNYVSYFGVAIK